MYYLYCLGNVLTSILPRKICYLLAKFFAVICYYISKRDRESVIYNLSPIVVDKSKLKQYAQEIFINFAYYLVDFFRYSKLNLKFIKKYVRISGLDNLKNVLAKGRGAIIFAAHLGNYELAGAIVALLGYPLSVVARTHEDRRINNFFDRQRQRVGMKVIPTGAAIRGCFLALKQGDTLALLGDRDFSGQGVKLEMFSRYAHFPRGVAFFALKTKAPIIPIFLVRENKNYYHLIFDKAISYSAAGEDQVAIIKQCNLVLEKYIKKYPQQWYVFQKYWTDNYEG
ncbi:MAG: lysophospholipid acyltransferase family protein [Candidatus Omnitrophota bacterium]